jgi:hypothetical protein
MPGSALLRFLVLRASLAGVSRGDGGAAMWAKASGGVRGDKMMAAGRLLERPLQTGETLWPLEFLN